MAAGLVTAGAPPARVQSFWRALRVLATSPAGWSMLLVAALVIDFYGPRTHKAYRLVAGLIGLPAIVGAAFVTEGLIGPSLAFMRTLPLRFPRRWLLLGPLCVVTLAGAVGGALARGAPLAPVLVKVGCCWWAVAVTRWALWSAAAFGGGAAWRARKVAFAALPLLLSALGPLVAWAGARAGGWLAAAAAAMGLGVAGLAFQPELAAGTRFTGTLRVSGGVPRAAAEPSRPLGRARVEREAQPSRLGAAVRLALFGATRIRLVLGTLLFVEVASMPGSPSRALTVLLFAMYAGTSLGTATPTAEFFAMLPIARAPLFVGRVLPRLLLGEALPAVIAVESWLGGPVCHVPARELVRLTLLAVVMMGMTASPRAIRTRGRWSWLPAVLTIPVLFLLEGASKRPVGSGPGTLLPLWVVAPLAALTVVMWWRSWRAR